MKIIPRCANCEAVAPDAGALMGDALEALCAHCGSHIIRHRAWKPVGLGGIRVAGDVFVCNPPDEGRAAT